MSGSEHKQDDHEITVLMNKFDFKKDNKYLFLSSSEATIDVITELLVNAGADFITVAQDTVTQKYCHILYHVPKGVDKGRFETHSEKAEKFESVIIYDQMYSLQLSEIENRGVHTNNRIMLYDEAEQNNQRGRDNLTESGGEFHE